jgi:hypothetical protein
MEKFEATRQINPSSPAGSRRELIAFVCRPPGVPYHCLEK